MDGEAGVDAVRDAGEEDTGVGTWRVDGTRRVEAPVDGKIEEKDWWDWETEGRGKGGPGEEEEELPIDLASVSRRTVFGTLTVGV